jgi:hypothetical protein
MAAEETELERLVVRLGGDSTEYQKMLEEVQKNTEETARHVEEAGKEIEGFGKKLKEFKNQVIEALEAAAVGEFLHSSFEAFSEQEKLLIQMESVLEANGREVEKLVERYEEWSEVVEHNTMVNREQAMELLKVAESYGLTAEAAEHASQAALGFAGITGRSAEGMMRLTAALEQGNLKMAMRMGRLVPQLRQFVGDPAAFVAAANRLVEAGLKATEREANTAAGSVKHLSYEWLQFKRAIGAEVAPVIKFLADSLRTVVGWLNNLSPEMKKTIAIAAGIGAALLAMVPAIAAVSIMIGPLVSLLGALGPIGLIVVGVLTALGVGMFTLEKNTGAFTKMLGGLQAQLTGFWDKIKPAIQGVIKALQLGDFETAWRVAWLQIKIIAFEVIDALMNKWHDLVRDFKDVWAELTAYVKSTFMEALAAIRKEVDRTLVDMPSYLGGISEKERAQREKDLDWFIRETKRGYDLEAQRQQLINKRAALEAKAAGGHSEEIAKMQEELDALLKELDEKEIPKKTLKKFEGFKVPEITADVKLIPRWDVAAFDSGEFRRRVEEFRSQLSIGADSKKTIEDNTKAVRENTEAMMDEGDETAKQNITVEAAQFA